MLLGDLEAQQGNDAAAIASWQRIESQNPRFSAWWPTGWPTPTAGPATSRRAFGYSGNYEDQYPSLDLLTTLFNQILAHDGPTRERS